MLECDTREGEKLEQGKVDGFFLFVFVLFFFLQEERGDGVSHAATPGKIILGRGITVAP